MDNPLIEHGQAKFPGAGVIASSATRKWTGVHAERRRHSAGELPAYRSTVTEITFALRGETDAFVHRTGSGHRQATSVRKGTIWLCPPDVLEDSTRITHDLSDILHVTLPGSLFDSVSQEVSGLAGRSIRYASDVEDPLMEYMLLAISGELTSETSSGGLLVESTALALSLRLASQHSESASYSLANQSGASLDKRRLRRVLTYVQDNLETDISVSNMAQIACMSMFHFSRAFKNTTGKAPHNFVSHRRLERAKTLLLKREFQVAEIALRCGFSNQSSFTKAFTRSTGLSPARYRKASS